MNRKPQKGSSSLRQALKGKTAKKSKSTQSESKATKNRPLYKNWKNTLRNLKSLFSVWLKLVKGMILKVT